MINDMIQQHHVWFNLRFIGHCIYCPCEKYHISNKSDGIHTDCVICDDDTLDDLMFYGFLLSKLSTTINYPYFNHSVEYFEFEPLLEKEKIFEILNKLKLKRVIDW